MKLIIDIPDGLYDMICANAIPTGSYYYDKYLIRMAGLICAATANGTPLPEGHGDLIDINNINEITLEDSLHIISYEKSNGVDCYIDAPVIVKADKEVEQE